METSEKYDQVKANKNHIFFNNFIGGIAWAFGATIGFTILIAIITFVFKFVNLVPIVGTFVLQIQDFISQNSPNLR